MLSLQQMSICSIINNKAYNMYDLLKEDKAMYFENTKIENIVVDQEFLTDILKNTA